VLTVVLLSTRSTCRQENQNKDWLGQGGGLGEVGKVGKELSKKYGNHSEPVEEMTNVLRYYRRVLDRKEGRDQDREERHIR
jgi:hypothetical protein